VRADRSTDRTRRGEQHRQPSFLTVPVRGGGVRTLVRLGAFDARRYAAAVARVTTAIESALGPTSYADRAAVRGTQVVFEDWRRARVRLRSAVAAQLRTYPRGVVFVGDVRACFPSITIEAVERALVRVGARPGEIEEVARVLYDLSESGISGLPVGPAPSAQLANAVLSTVDRAFRAEGIKALRWVDDVVAICADVPRAAQARSVFHRALAAEGLEANPSKTRVLVDRDQATAALLGSERYSPATGQRAMLRP
jgi:hypothetical protein